MNVVYITVLLFEGLVSFAICVQINNESSDRLFEIVNASNSANEIVRVATPMPQFATSRMIGSGLKRRVITVLALVPYGGSAYPVGPMLTKSMEVALDRLRRQESWLSAYELAIEVLDDECNDAVGIGRLVRRLKDGRGKFDDGLLPIVLNVGCGSFAQLELAETVKYFDFMMFTVVPLAPELFVHRKKYSSFFGLGERADINHIAFAAFIAQMGWKRIAIIGEKWPFYDVNEAQLIPMLELQNVTLAWYGKINYMSSDSDEMSNAFSEMQSHDPRVILLDVDSAVSFACWLHRFGMYGANYVTFFFYWSPLDPKSTIPKYIKHWCTADMLADVMMSSIIFGDTNLVDAFGYDTVEDSTGLVGSNYMVDITSRISHPEESPYWPYSSTYCYDMILFTGYLLNTTENLLQTRNETLLDLTVSRRKSRLVTPVIKEALYETPLVRGFKGEYKFEEETTVNSGGYTPIMFSQVRITKTGAADFVTVAMYKSNLRQPLSVSWEKLMWRTKDGRPPRDTPHVVEFETSLIPEGVSSTLIAFGVVETATAAGFLVFSAVSKRVCLSKFTFFPEDIFIFAGNLLIASHAFALPISLNNSKAIHQNCNAVASLICLGFACSIFGLAVKINVLALHRVSKSGTRTSPKASKTRTRDGSRISSSTNWGNSRILEIVEAHTHRKLENHVIAGMGFVWLVVNAVLVGVFLGVGSIETAVRHDTSFVSPEDSSLIFKPFYYKCGLAVINREVASLLPLSLLALFHLIVMVYSAVTACIVFSLKSTNAAEAKSAGTSVYCCCLVIVAAALVALTVNDRWMLCVASAASLVIAVTNVAPVFLTKVVPRQ